MEWNDHHLCPAAASGHHRRQSLRVQRAPSPERAASARGVTRSRELEEQSLERRGKRLRYARPSLFV
eukprot:scaffold1554_cov401-Prasinococcus_capsulatus_cf.AAC.5